MVLQKLLCRKLLVVVLWLCCSMLQVSFAEDSPPATKGWSEGLDWIGAFDFINAKEKFASARQNAKKGSEEWQKATFALAICTQQIVPHSQALMEEAESLYAEVEEAAPESELAAYSILHRGRIAELIDYANDKPDLPKARVFYQKVIDKYIAFPVANEAAFRLAGSYVQTFEESNVRKGIEILENWLKKYPGNYYASPMWQYLGDSYFYPLKSYEKSLAAYIKADEIGLVDEAKIGEVFWRMGVIADRYLNDRENAVKFYTKIISVTPTSGKAFEAQVALKRLGAPIPEIKLYTEFGAGNTAENKSSEEAK